MYFEKELRRGYNPYIDTKLDDMGTQMDVGVLVLEAGDEYSICEADKETAVLLLEGDAILSYGDVCVEIHRPDCFRHEAWCLLAPKGTAIHLKGTSHAEFYIQQTLNSNDYAVILYTPETVQTQHAGSNGELMGAMQREIKTFFDYENAPFSNMVLGEVLNYPGKWSSYPPHHHPQPEVYFFRFDKPQGFGAGFGNAEIYRTGHNGLAVINHGLHSQTAAPGYALCYVWGIRHLDGNPWEKTRIDDEEHAWLWKPDANEHIYKG